MKLNEIKARQEEIAVEMQAIGNIAKDESRDLTEQEVEQVNALSAESAELDEKKVAAEKLAAAMDAIVNAKLTSDSALSQPEHSEEIEQVESKIPAVAKSQKSKVFASSEDAYIAGMFFAAVGGVPAAQKFMADQSLTDNKGGYATPNPVSSELVNLIEQYGVARSKARRIIMSADTWSGPKVTDHATIYYPAEAAAITASDVTLGQITMNAKKMAALIKMSTEITEDALISMADLAMNDIAYGFAIEEDENLFNGKASAINADGIKGDSSVADTNVASVAALALSDLTAATVAIGNPVVGARNEWYINPTLYHGAIRDLLNAAGGNTISDLEGGQRPSLLGYPVNFVNVLPGASASASGDVLAVFGDLSLGCYFGDRRSVTFKMLNELFAVNDQVGVQATQRLDLVVANPEVLSKITLT